MITIDLLKNHSDNIWQFVKILHDSLGKWTPATLTEVEVWLTEWLNENIPLAYVALDGNVPVGICSLQFNDGIRADLMPWFGDLCVVEAYQNQGIGEMLIDAITAKVRELGFNKLYLIAPDRTIPEYYERLGWKKLDMDEYNGHPVTLMHIEL